MEGGAFPLCCVWVGKRGLDSERMSGVHPDE